MMMTLKKAPAIRNKKDLVSDLKKPEPFVSFVLGDDNNAATTEAPTTIIIQTSQGLWEADICQPKVLYVISSSARETQGSFFKVGIQ